MLRFSFSVVNADKLDRAFGRLVAQVKDWTNVWPQVARQITKIEGQKFPTQGALGGHGEWAALKPEYAQRKRKMWGDEPIEQASGKLRDAVLELGPGHVERFAALQMAFGVDGQVVPHAIFQQTGFRTRLGTGKGRQRAKVGGKAFVEPRRLFDFTQRDKDAIRQAIQREALQTARRRGFHEGSADYADDAD